MLLDALPRTPNGKIDRKALPEQGKEQAARPAATSEGSSQKVSVETAATPFEAKIRAIWCDLLHLSHVGREDNFFDIGGHSLLAIQLHRRLLAIAPGAVSLTDIFRFPTIAALGAHLSSESAPDAATREGQDRALARRAAQLRRGAVRSVMRT